MSKTPKNPPPAPTPAPTAKQVTDEIGEDIIKSNRKRKTGRKESFLTQGQSLLGKGIGNG